MIRISSVYGLSLAALMVVVPVATLAQSDADAGLPRLSFPMPATGYPQEALVANQEGTVVLRLSIAADGSMAEVTVAESSGYPILDDAAVLVARAAKLSTPPVTPDGQPATAAALADAVWQLPLESAEEYFANPVFDGPRPSPDDLITVPAVDPDNANYVGQRDYPATALRLRQSGRVGAYVLIAEDGTVHDAVIGSSSSVESLDDATLRITRRFRYLPGMINGVPAAMWVPQRIVWATGSGSVYVQPCYEVPLLDVYARRRTVPDGEALPPIERWTLYRRDGMVAAGLVLTEHGWMKLAPALVEAMNAQPGPGEDSRRPEECWFYDGLNPMMRE